MEALESNVTVNTIIRNNTLMPSSSIIGTTNINNINITGPQHNMTVWLEYIWNISAGNPHHFIFNWYNFTFYNETVNPFSPCPSIQMPMGNLISMILYTAVCIIGLLGNTLVIYVVLRFSKMQTVTNIYILNLAIADECFLIGIPFLIVTMHLGEWTFGSTMCKAYMVSTSITQFTSSIFLFIMSADRYIAVCHPVTATRWRTPYVSKVVSGIAWTASALIMLPVILYSNTITYPVSRDKVKVSCIIMWPQEVGVRSPTMFTLYSLILGFAIPLTLIFGFYYLVIRRLRTVGPKTKSKEKRRSHRKVTQLVLIVITVYMLCWLPYWISQVALINSPPDICKTRLEITIFVLVGCLGYSNSAMNPILYAFLSENFKKSFLKACTCAKSNDINAQLQAENSFFTKLAKKNSEKNCSKSNKHNSKHNIISNVDCTGGIMLDSPPMLVSSRTGTTPCKYEDNLSKPPVLHTDL